MSVGLESTFNSNIIPDLVVLYGINIKSALIIQKLGSLRKLYHFLIQSNETFNNSNKTFSANILE